MHLHLWLKRVTILSLSLSLSVGIPYTFYWPAAAAVEDGIDDARIVVGVVSIHCLSTKIRRVSSYICKQRHCRLSSFDLRNYWCDGTLNPKRTNCEHTEQTWSQALYC